MVLPAVAQAQTFTNNYGIWGYEDNSNGTCTIDGYTGSGGAVTIPSIINGLTVTSIAYEGLRDQSSLTSVIVYEDYRRCCAGGGAICFGSSA